MSDTYTLPTGFSIIIDKIVYVSPVQIDKDYLFHNYFYVNVGTPNFGIYCRFPNTLLATQERNKLMKSIQSYQSPRTENAVSVIKDDDFVITEPKPSREYAAEFDFILFRPIRDLELSTRCTNWLERAGIKLVGDLVRYETKKIGYIRHLGPKSWSDIVSVLNARGLKLNTKLKGWPILDLDPLDHIKIMINGIECDVLASEMIDYVYDSESHQTKTLTEILHVDCKEIDKALRPVSVHYRNYTFKSIRKYVLNGTKEPKYPSSLTEDQS